MHRIFRFRFWITDAILILLIFLCFSNASLVVYLLGQGKGQLKIILNSTPVDDAFSSGKLSVEEKEKLKLIRQVKDFSENKLGFESSSSYEKYFNQQGKTILWIVTACEPFALNDFKWDFPLLGSVSYKGFFDSLQAVRECQQLRINGYDAEVSPVAAWSTLGFLSDPVFSSMLKKHKGELAELIFHELFHGTIYVSGDVDLNENLAEFVAEKATLMFLNGNQLVIDEYMRDRRQYEEISGFAKVVLVRLNQFYQSMKNEKLKPEKQLLLKDSLFTLFEKEMESNEQVSSSVSAKIVQRIRSGKNAFFMHFNRYEGLKDSLENVFRLRYNGNLPFMIKELQTTCKSF
jgi:predicted aminopeptidase